MKYNNITIKGKNGVITKIYKNIVQVRFKNGNEARRVIESNSNIDYRNKLDKELNQLKNQEIWNVAREIRKLRI